mmetsp:Transcript_55194/g.62483  ORF Transcript_55194/g.62483 Transcript_55194/m.62483 type:complete len:137 (+) Transcript_55194:619-1029(+)
MEEQTRVLITDITNQKQTRQRVLEQQQKEVEKVNTELKKEGSRLVLLEQQKEELKTKMKADTHYRHFLQVEQHQRQEVAKEHSRLLLIEQQKEKELNATVGRVSSALTSLRLMSSSSIHDSSSSSVVVIVVGGNGK